MGDIRLNTLLDGLLHAATYVFVLTGLVRFWSAACKGNFIWSVKLLVGSELMGFGIFKLVEGTVNHHILGLHHISQTEPRAQRIYWNIGFLI